MLTAANAGLVEHEQTAPLTRIQEQAASFGVRLGIGALVGWFSLTTGLPLNEGNVLLIIASGPRLVASRDTGHQSGQVDEQLACAA